MAKAADRDHETDQLCAAYLKAVADPLRLKVTGALQVGPLSVSDVTELLEQFNLPNQIISKAARA